MIAHLTRTRWATVILAVVWFGALPAALVMVWLLVAPELWALSERSLPTQ